MSETSKQALPKLFGKRTGEYICHAHNEHMRLRARRHLGIRKGPGILPRELVENKPGEAPSDAKRRARECKATLRRLGKPYEGLGT